MTKAIHPTITKEQFESLGFRQAYWRKDQETGGTWSIRFVKELNDKHRDELEVQWSCCSERYAIMRHTEGLRNIFLFEGFLNKVEDLTFLISLFDFRKFYETSNETIKPFLIARNH